MSRLWLSTRKGRRNNNNSSIELHDRKHIDDKASNQREGEMVEHVSSSVTRRMRTYRTQKINVDHPADHNPMLTSKAFTLLSPSREKRKEAWQWRAGTGLYAAAPPKSSSIDAGGRFYLRVACVPQRDHGALLLALALEKHVKAVAQYSEGKTQ
ncbi:hypothetical protein C4D60_Mb03t17820 [Musa balbisiana]|uniref:Uncharacterized protein n=1 Tax=Musa balbisiana TaxID=52838 RepID=A0A4S8JAQ7_MUSBA|nr:hypothetical protein C4D60_Mb03t17820 [Musa balbisiana]